MLSRFWSESFWLPANTTWEDVSNERGKTIVYAEPKDFWAVIPMTIIGLTLRFLSERYIFSPIGRYLKISNYKVTAPANAKLEAAYRGCKNITSLAKQLDLPQREIERWWRLRRRQDKPTTLIKFCETSWKGINYLSNVSVAVYVAWEQEWAWDLDKCFDGHPHQGITPGIWWIYMLGSSYYLSLIITQFRDVCRKDFWQMCIHHFTTFSLFYFSWICQCFRMGCIVIILHDISDVVLELGKAAKYAKFQRVVNYLFAVFVCIWVTSRLLLIPFFVLPANFKHRTSSNMSNILCHLLLLLFSLSMFWTWLIFKLVHRTLCTGEFLNDVRSSDSEDGGEVNQHKTD